MKIQENSKKFNIFLQILMCFFIEIWPKNDILTQKKLRKIPGIQPTYDACCMKYFVLVKT